jgi:predicted aspartyl protease
VDADGVTYPFVPASIQTDSGEWIACPLLLDTGAERTVIAAEIVEQLGFPPIHLSAALTGVGGLVGALQLPSRLELSVGGESTVIINGPFVGLLESTLEQSVLGRDVLGNFAVIVDRPGNTICLLHGKHRYVIQET